MISSDSFICHSIGWQWAQVRRAWRGHDYRRLVIFGFTESRKAGRLRAVRIQNLFLEGIRETARMGIAAEAMLLGVPPGEVEGVLSGRYRADRPNPCQTPQRGIGAGLVADDGFFQALEEAARRAAELRMFGDKDEHGFYR